MIEEFHYQISWRTHSAHPGHHPGQHSGGEHDFQGHAPLISHPEPHNIDVHASLLDPFQQFVVRTYRQRGVITMTVLADLSASMGFQNKMATLAKFTEQAAYSAFRNGDHFGFIGCDQDLMPDFYLPPRWYKSGAAELAERIRHYRPDSPNAQGLLNIAEYCPRHRSLIFLVSDFHYPLPDITSLFDSLLKHDVVPVVVWHPKEYESLPDWGLFVLSDPETGREKNLLLRPGLKKKIIDAFNARREQLKQVFIRYGRQPFYLNDAFTADQMTRYFYEQ